MKGRVRLKTDAAFYYLTIAMWYKVCIFIVENNQRDPLLPPALCWIDKFILQT